MVANYHGEPSMCKDAKDHPVACCVHGMATFIHWHRLYVVHFEQALVRHGLNRIGVPYWDWTQPLTELPALVQARLLFPAMDPVKTSFATNCSFMFAFAVKTTALYYTTVW